MGNTRGRRSLKSSFIALPLVSLTGLLILSLVLSHINHRSAIARLEYHLYQLSLIYSRALEGEIMRSGALERWNAQEFVSLLSQDADARVTVITIDGTVLADNRANPSEMDNHADRPEIARARINGQAYSTRFSATLGYRLMYFARLIEPIQSEPFVLRISMPMADFNADVRKLFFTIGLVSIAIMGLSTYIIYRLSKWMQVPLEKIVLATAAIEQGEADVDLNISSPQELAQIANSMKRMNKGITQSMELLRDKREQLDQMLNASDEAMVYLDRNYNILDCNDAAARQLHEFGHRIGWHFYQGETQRGAIEAIRGESLLSLLRSSELNDMIDECFAAGHRIEGNCQVYLGSPVTISCIVTLGNSSTERLLLRFSSQVQ